MSEFKLQSDAIEVPPGTGVEGFVHALRSILKLPRVQNIHIDSKGKVTYERYTKEDEAVALGDIGFEDLEPWPIIRNRDIEELTPPCRDPASIVLEMFQKVGKDGLDPTSFVTGANSILKIWMTMGGASMSNTNTLFGLTVHTDRHVPDTVLMLTAAYTKDAGLVDTQKSYKIEMDQPEMPVDRVEVL
jgi:hypothetical protein